MIRFFTLLCCCGLALQTTAQPYHNDVRNRPMFWSELNAVYGINDTWSLQLDLQYRRKAIDNEGADLHAFRYPLQQVFRPWVNYQVSKPVRLSISPIGLWWTWARKQPDHPTTFFKELRTTEQLQTTHRLGDGQFIFRQRAEFRWFSGNDTLARTYDFLTDNELLPVEAHRFSVRLRAMARWINPILGPGSRWYSHLSIEPMLSLSRAGGTRFDQNRIYVALGRNVGKKTRFELGYMNQFVLQTNHAERLHTLRLNHALHLFVFLEHKRQGQQTPPVGPD